MHLMLLTKHASENKTSKPRFQVLVTQVAENKAVKPAQMSCRPATLSKQYSYSEIPADLSWGTTSL